MAGGGRGEQCGKEAVKSRRNCGGGGRGIVRCGKESMECRRELVRMVGGGGSGEESVDCGRQMVSACVLSFVSHLIIKAVRIPQGLSL
jgi:hypothetical protein